MQKGVKDHPCSTHRRCHLLKARMHRPQAPLHPHPHLPPQNLPPHPLPGKIEFKAHWRISRTYLVAAFFHETSAEEVINRHSLQPADQESTRRQHEEPSCVPLSSFLNLLVFIFIRFGHPGRQLGLSLVSPPFFELLFRLLMFMTGLNYLLELATGRKFSCRFCGFFTHLGCQKTEERRRNFEVIGDRLT